MRSSRVRKATPCGAARGSGRRPPRRQAGAGIAAGASPRPSNVTRSTPMRCPLPLTCLLLALAACGRADPGAAGARGAGAGGEARGLVFSTDDCVDPERPYFHDFGTLQFGEQAEHTYRAHNADDVPVAVLGVDPACKCSRLVAIRAIAPDGTVVPGDVRRDADGSALVVVPPGGDLELVVGIDTRAIRANTEKLAVMKVRTDSPHVGSMFINLEQHVFPKKLFGLTPQQLSLGDVPTSAGGGNVVRVMTGKQGWSARVLGVHSTSPELEAEIQELPGQGEVFWNVAITLRELQPVGYYRGEVVLATTDENGEGDAGRLVIDVHANVVEDVQLYPAHPSFELVTPGEPKVLHARVSALVPGARIAVTAVRATLKEVAGSAASPAHAPHVTVSATPASPDAQGRSPVWELTLVCSGDLPFGRFTGLLEVETDDEARPYLRCTFVGQVQTR